MNKLPVLKPNEVVKVFEKDGWVIKRRTGSHITMGKPGYRTVLSIPCHKGKDVKRGTLRDLIRDAKLTIDTFITLLKGKRTS